ncbi:MAG: hypothetical protein H0U35_01160, partial [Sporichthyaceae bacterium]|nr:hypothetical protein [Sporichthyaceae bacterium]
MSDQRHTGMGASADDDATYEGAHRAHGTESPGASAVPASSTAATGSSHAAIEGAEGQGGEGTGAEHPRG